MKALCFETGSGLEFEEAADAVLRPAERFCATHDGSTLGAIDPVLKKLAPCCIREEDIISR